MSLPNSPDADDQFWRDVRTVDLGFVAFLVIMAAFALASFLIVGVQP